MLQDIRWHDGRGHGRSGDLQATPSVSVRDTLLIVRQRQETGLTGAMTLDLMLYLIPSLARVMVKAINPATTMIDNQPPRQQLSSLGDTTRLTFTGRIVDLSQVSIQTRSRGSVDDPSILPIRTAVSVPPRRYCNNME